MKDTLIIVVAQYAIVLLPLLVIAVFARLEKLSRIKYFIALGLGGILGLLGIVISSHLFFDPRPFVNSNVIPLFKHAADNGFPSDHTTISIILAGITFFFSRKIGTFMLVLGVAIGSARVLAHVHSWVDIAGGIVIGIIVTIVSICATKTIARKWLQDAPLATKEEVE